MATEQHAQIVEHAIDYKFQFKRNLLFQAITAAGAVEENWDGNRKLAQFGTALSHTTDFKCSLSSNKQRAVVAERTGIDKCIKYSEKPGAQSSIVLAKAVNAIVGAVFLDCGGTISVVLRVMQRLGIFTSPDQTIDPAMLSLHTVSNFPDVASLGKALLGGEVEGNSSPAPRDQNQSPIAPTVMQSFGRNSVTAARNNSEDQTGQSPHIGAPGDDFNLNLFVDYSSLTESPNIDLGLDGQGASNHNPSDDPQEYGQSVTKRKAIRTTRCTGKKQCLGSSLSQGRDSALTTYILEETRRCEAVGSRPPQETFFTPIIRQKILDLDPARVDTLSKFLVYIASPHSIALLQDMLLRSRTRQNYEALHLGLRLSKLERFNMIRTLDQHVVYLQLLRRYHILELFKECGGTTTRLGSGFVLATQHDFEQTRNKPGNPTNSAEAQVTAKMMDEIFPDVRPGSDEYQSKYRVMTDLRKLGQRLHILETTFGSGGILGLMPSHVPLGQLDLGITDTMITMLPNSVFRRFVTLLDESQGVMLREFSAVVSTVVEALVGQLPQHEQFNLERVQSSDIFKFPKGSHGLLSLIG